MFGCSRFANPLTACLTGCGILTTLMGFLTITTFAPMSANNYVMGFTKQPVNVQRVRCLDVTNQQNYYDIPIPPNTATEPPVINQTAIPTLYVVDNIFLRKPYYQLHVTTNESHTYVYSLRYKFMNQCGELGELLVRNFVWNHTFAYVYFRGSDTYPFAFPSYDAIIPFAIGSCVMLLGALILVSAFCAGTPGCPIYNWTNGRQLGSRSSRSMSRTASAWGAM